MFKKFRSMVLVLIPVIIVFAVISVSCSKKHSFTGVSSADTVTPVNTATTVVSSATPTRTTVIANTPTKTNTTTTAANTATQTLTTVAGGTSTFTPTATATPTTVVSSEVLFADFDDGNAGNKFGGWTYVSCDSANIYGDGVTASGGGYDGTGYAYHVTITTAASINYCNIESQLSANGATVVDLSGYTGIKFWAKGTGNFKYFIADTTAYDPPTYNFTVSSTWTEYIVVFSTMTRGGWGTQTVAQLLAASKVVDWAPTDASSSVELYLDNIRFY